MPMGDKTKSTYEKVAETAKKKAGKYWARAKNGGHGSDYERARIGYTTADRARQKAESMDD